VNKMKSQKIVLGIAVSVALCFTAAHAQDQKSDPQSGSPSAPSDSGASDNYGKKPAAVARGVSQSYSPQSYDPTQVQPDTNTLSGAENLGVGSLTHARNIFDPSITGSVLGMTAPTGTGTQTTFGQEGIFGGSLVFNRIWDRYNFTASYNGGENISRNLSNSNSGQFHDLTLAQEIEFARWRLRLRDDFITSPGAAFTGTGMGGPGLIGQFSDMMGGLTGVAQRFMPAQTIQTGSARRYENAALGQAEYSFSRRSAITFSGSYGLLRFADAGYIDSHMVSSQVGYDYMLDPKNSIAVIAGYGNIDYSGTPNVGNSTSDYTAAFAYGRKITGRLAFQVAVGPERIQVLGSPSGTFQRWMESVRSSLTYQRRRDGYSFSYSRGLTGGSGVFIGAVSDTFNASAHRQFSRFWTGTVTGGYAFNKSLAPANSPTSSFANWFVGGNVNRQLGRHAQIGFNYGLQKQENPATCPVANCGVNDIQQSFGMTVNWHLHPTE
jgi:hypothetical protein